MQIWVKNLSGATVSLYFEVAKVSYQVPADWWMNINGNTGDAEVVQYHEGEV